MSQELTLLPLTEEVKMRVKVVEGEPYWLDVDLGRWLGFDQPRDIRKLIKRHDANLLKTGVRAMVARIESNNNSVTENWLSFQSCLFLCAKSQTDRANDVTIAMVQFIDGYRKGEIVTQMGSNVMVAISANLERIVRITDGLAESTRGLVQSQEEVNNRLTSVENKIEYLQDYVESTSKHRKEITRKTKDAHQFIIEKCYGGKCPICCETVIVSGGKRTNDIRFDHAYSNQQPDVSHTWAICSSCHDQLTTGRMGRTGDISDLINAYQFHVKRIINPSMQKKSANSGRVSLPSLFAKLACQ